MTPSNRENTICLFDVDGTLTPARKQIDDRMLSVISELKKTCTVGVVSGSDEEKINWQLNNQGHVISDYLFTENGCVAYKDGKLIHSQNFVEFLGEEKYKKLVNFCLRYIADLDLPFKRGTFVELRTGLMNVCPIGRSCTYEQRLEFYEYDKKTGIREAFANKLREEFSSFGLQFAIGGQISIDCFPCGWDKRHCLTHIDPSMKVHFFGDRVDPGGNDHEVYEDPRTIGHKVTDPQDTERQLRELFDLKL